MEIIKLKSINPSLLENDPYWPHKKADVTYAISVITQYIKRDGAVKLVEGFEEKGDSLTITMPEWHMELIRYFNPLYAEQTPEVIYQIMTIVFADVFGPPHEEFVLKAPLKRIF